MNNIFIHPSKRSEFIKRTHSECVCLVIWVVELFLVVLYNGHLVVQPKVDGVLSMIRNQP